MTLGDLIKEYRSKNSLSMADFADKSGISKAYISLLEKNEHPKTKKEIVPSIEVIKKVADAMGKDFEEIFTSIDSTTKIVLNSQSDIYWNFAKDKVSTAADEALDLPAGAIPYVPGPMVLIPLVGSVNCGTPLFADENIEEYIPTRKSEMLSGEKYFYLKAKGDSMINAGIQDGDLLFIRKQSDVNSGDIAVVTINGDEATLKRVIKKENALVLQPENPSYETKIYVGSEVNNICIKGRLMKVEKTF